MPCTWGHSNFDHNYGHYANPDPWMIHQLYHHHLHHHIGQTHFPPVIQQFVQQPAAALDPTTAILASQWLAQQQQLNAYQHVQLPAISKFLLSNIHRTQMMNCSTHIF